MTDQNKRLAPRASGRADQKAHSACVDDLAHEAIRRLAFHRSRVGGDPAVAGERLIEMFCDCLVSQGDADSFSFVEDLRANGVPSRDIHLFYVLPAARKLGQDWSEDRRGFAEVSLASARLHRIVRQLGRQPDERRATAWTCDVPRALLALAPGETHSLGIEVLGNLLRDDDWDVDLCFGDTRAQMMERMRRKDHDVVVLVSYNPSMAGALIELMRNLRRLQPDRCRLALAGGFLEQTSQDALDHADSLLMDLRTAVADMRRLTRV